MATAASTTAGRLFCATGGHPCALCLHDVSSKPSCAHPALGWPHEAPLPATCPLPPAPQQGRA